MKGWIDLKGESPNRNAVRISEIVQIGPQELNNTLGRFVEVWLRGVDSSQIYVGNRDDLIKTIELHEG